MGSLFINALAFDPEAIRLYGTDFATDQLIEIDPATGASTAVGPTRHLGVSGLTYVAAVPRCILKGDVNDDGVLNGADVSAFVRAKLDVPHPGDNPACADYGTGCIQGDISLFVADLIQ